MVIPIILATLLTVGVLVAIYEVGYKQGHLKGQKVKEEEK